jgi:hypothetical protein
VAALFAIPSQDFPYNGSVNWSIRKIAAGMGKFLVPVILDIMMSKIPDPF